MIGGFVEGGYIRSGGTITVRNGIIGRAQAGGRRIPLPPTPEEIHASYAQYARLEADGDIHILSQLSHRYYRSGQDLKVGTAPCAGHLIGGVAHRQPAHRGTGARSLGGQPGPGCRSSVAGFRRKELALRQRKQTCAEQIDKLQDLSSWAAATAP